MQCLSFYFFPGFHLQEEFHFDFILIKTCGKPCIPSGQQTEIHLLSFAIPYIQLVVILLSIGDQG